MIFDKFYPIFDTSEWLKRLLPIGIKFVQLRIKDKSKKEITSFKRTHFINKDLKKGQKLKIDDIYTKRIGKDCSIINLLKLIGKKTIKDLNTYSKINKKDFI